MEVSIGAPGCSSSLEADRIHVDGKTIRYDDILRVEPINEKNENTPNRLELITYPPGSKNRRQEKRFLLTFKTPKESNQWLSTIEAKTSRRLAPHRLDGKPANRVLVIVNPYAGQKKCWTNEIRPILEQARIDYDLIETERSGQGTEIALNCDLDRFDAVLIDSGDGLVSEFLRGLLLRKDRQRAMKFPICHITGGTSNGLAATVCFACNEKFPAWDLFAKEMTLMVARPRYLPLRIFRVDTEKNGTHPMFMSASWGLMADIDIGSERFRWAGLLRLHMEAWIRVTRLPQTSHYRCRLSYIPLGNKEITRKTTLFYDVEREKFGPNHFEYPEIEQATSQDKVLSAHFESVEEAMKGQETLKMPPLNEPLGDEWVSFESEFAMVFLGTLSHLSTDLAFLPSSRLDDDFIYLVLIEWEMIRHRLQVADLLKSMDASKHLLNRALQIIPVRACRVEPLGPHKFSGYFAVDGEALENNTAFQVAPTKQVATVIGRDEVRP